MRSWTSRRSQTSPAPEPAGKRWRRPDPEPAGKRRRRPGPRGLAVSAVAAVALAGTVAGVAAAGVTSGHESAGRSADSHRSGAGVSGTGRSGPGRSGTDRSGAGGTRVRTGASSAGTSTGTSARTAGAKSTLVGTGRTAKPGSRGAAQPATRTAAGPTALRTSCRNVAHVGDSTSVDLISPDYLPDPAQRLAARYADVGVRHLTIDASGGRSIVEEMPGQINGYKVASGWRSQGYRGCWVFALGTNDTANVAAGSSIGMMARIDQMMAVAHGQPVMWVNTRTLLPSGYWSSANERTWDATLVKALAKYPNMRIFDWSAVAQPGWFLSDGIHYNSLGCAMRAKAIANALARAFPLNGRSAGKIVR